MNKGLILVVFCLIIISWIIIFSRNPAVESAVVPSKQRSNYSQSKCVGSTKSNDRSWLYRSCHLQNVCYDGNPKSQLIYYKSPQDDITADQLSVNWMVPYIGDGRSPIFEQKVTVIEDTLIPKNALWPHTEDVVTVLMNWFIPSVWSHLLMDNIFPIFRLMEIFSLDTDTTIEPLYLENPCPTSPECGLTGKQYKPNLTSLLSYGKWPLLQIKEKYNNVTVCFEHVLVGPSLYSDHGFGDSQHGRIPSKPDWLNWGIGGTMLNFRNFILNRASISLELTVEYDVVFLQKGSLAWINNQLDLSQLITLFKNSAVNNPLRILDDVRLENMTLRNQILLASKTKVIVAQEGSTAFGALWLPPGGTLILIGNEELDYYFWNNVAHLRTRFLRLQNIHGIIKAIWSGLESFGKK